MKREGKGYEKRVGVSREEKYVIRKGGLKRSICSFFSKKCGVCVLINQGILDLCYVSLVVVTLVEDETKPQLQILC